MQSSDIPGKFQVPFGAMATPGVTIRPVPVTSADQNAASFTQGFPINTMTPQGAGGQPPDGRDFNGILNAATAWIQWVQAGGAPIQYDAVFQAQIGGYPAGARVTSAVSGAITYLSTADNNVTDPDAAGAGWVNLNAVGGVLNGFLPNPGMATGAAATNVGTLGGDLAGTLPNPTIKSSVNLTGSPTIGTTPSVADLSQKIASTGWAFPGRGVGTPGFQRFGSGMLLQWNGQVFATQVTTTITLPISYTSFFLVFAQIGSGLPSTGGITVGAQAISISQFTLIPGTPNPGSVGVNWFTIGY